MSPVDKAPNNQRVQQELNATPIENVTPEAALDAVASALEKVETGASKTLLQKAEQLRKKARTAQATQEQVDSLIAEVKTTMPEVYRSVAGSIGRWVESAGKGNESIRAVNTAVEQAAKWSNEAIEQVKTAAEATGTAAADSAKKAINAAEQAGAGGMVKKAIQVAGEMLEEWVNAIVWFFKGILELLKKMLSGVAGLFWVEGLFGDSKQEKGESPKSSNAENTKETPKLTPEQIAKNVSDDIRKNLIDDLKNNWQFDLNDPKKVEWFEKVWASHGPYLKSAILKSQAFLDPEAKHNPLDTALQLGLFAPSFLFDLVVEWVIPVDAIKVKIVDGSIHLAIKSVTNLTKLWTDQMNGVLAKLSVENFGKDNADMTPEQKSVLNQLFVRQNVVWLYLLALIGGEIARLTTWSIAWNQGVGFQGIFANANNLVGNFDRAAENMKHVVQYLWGTGDLEKIGTAQKNAKMLFEEYVTKANVAKAVQWAQTQAEMLARLTELQGKDGMSKSILDELTQTTKNAKSIESARTDLAREVRKLHSGDPRDFMNGLSDRVKSQFVKTAKYGEVHYDEMAHSLRKQLNTYGTAIEFSKDGGYEKVVKFLRQSIGFAAGNPSFELAKQAQMAVVPVKLEDSKKFTEGLQHLAYESPELVRSFFRNFSIVIVGVSSATAPLGDKTDALLSGLTSLVPLVGPIIFMHDGFQFQGARPVQVWLIGLGATQLTIESVELVNILRGPDRVSNLVRFAWRPVTMTYDLVRGVAQTASIVRTLGRAAIRGEIAAMEASRALTRTAAGAAIAAALIISTKVWFDYLTSDSIDEDKLAKFMSDEKLLDAAGNVRMEAVQNRYSRFTSDEKEKFRKYLAQLHLGSDISGTSVSDGYKFSIPGAAPTVHIEEFLSDMAKVEPQKKIHVTLSNDAIQQWTKHLRDATGGNDLIVKERILKDFAAYGVTPDRLKEAVPYLYKNA